MADHRLDREVLKAVIQKTAELAGMRKDVAFTSERLQVSECRVCKLMRMYLGSYRYEPRPDRNVRLRKTLVTLARQKRRYGYRRLHALLVRRDHPASVMAFTVFIKQSDWQGGGSGENGYPAWPQSRRWSDRIRNGHSISSAIAWRQVEACVPWRWLTSRKTVSDSLR